MENSPKEIEEKAEQLYDYVMRFIKENYSYTEIKQFLIGDGHNEETAKAIIANVQVIEKRKAKETMKIGALLIAVGVVLTALSYVAPATILNQKYNLIVYGPVIAGIITFLRGYSKSK